MDYSGTVDYDVNTPFKYEGDEPDTVPQSDDGGVNESSRVHHHQDDLIYPPLDFATPTPQAMDNLHSVPSSNTHLLDSHHSQSLGDNMMTNDTTTNSHISNNISRTVDDEDTTALAMETESIHETDNQPPSSPESEDLPLSRRTAPARRGRGRPARSTRTNKSFAEADDDEEEEFDQKPPKGFVITPLLGTQSIFSSLIQKERRTQLTKGAKKKKKTEPEFCRFCFTNELHLQKVRTAKLPSTSSNPNTKFTALVPSVIETIQLGLTDKWTNPSFALVCDDCVQVFSSFYEFRTNVETNDALLRKLYCKSKAKSKKLPPSAPATPTPTPPPSSSKGGKRGKAKPDPSSAEDSEAVSTVSTKLKKTPGRRGRPPKASAVTDDDDYETDGYLSSVSKTSRKSTTSKKGGSKKKRGVTTDDDTDGYISSVSRKSTTVTNTSAAAKNAKKKRRYNSDSDNEDVKSDVSDGMDFGGPTPYAIKQEKMSEDEDGQTLGYDNYDQDYEEYSENEIEHKRNKNIVKQPRNRIKLEKNNPDSLTVQYGWNQTFTKMVQIQRGKAFGAHLWGTKPDQDDELGEDFLNSGKLGTRAEVYSEDEGGHSNSGDESEYGRNKIEKFSRGVGRQERKYLFIKTPFTGFYCKDIPLSRTGTNESSADLVWNRTCSKLLKRSEVRLGERKPKEPEVEDDVLAEREQEREKTRAKPCVGYEPAEERYPCRLCDVVVTKYTRLVAHLREVHNEKPEKSIICDICAKTFTTLKCLSQHLRRQHGDEPKEICEICSAEVSNMSQHKITHEAPRLRCEFCSKPFRRNMDLKYHVRAVHTTDASTLIACEVCGKTFALQSYLNRHMRSHTQAKPYKCVCGEGYNFNVSLKAHKVKCALYLESLTAGDQGN